MSASSTPLRRNTLIGLIASLALAIAKFLAGLVGHSSALIADGVESLADLAGSAIVWQGLRIADKPPDDDHPYGHGRAEALAALGVGALLIVAAGFIITRSVGEILTPHQAPARWTLVVLVVVIAVKEGLFRLILRGAESTGSSAAHADAWHHRADAITSVIALVGVTLAIWGPGWFGSPKVVLADEVAALLASGIIIFTAISLIRPALEELLDADAKPLAAEIARTASAVDGVRLVEKVHARKSGRGYLVDMHLHVPAEMDVRAAHALAGKTKAVIRAAHPNITHVLIHIEPDER